MFSLFRSNIIASRGYAAGSNSAWSMSRLWNSMKKGLGASGAPSPSSTTSSGSKQSQLKPANMTNTLSNRPPKKIDEKTAPSKPLKPNDYIWEPTLKTFSEDEIRKFEVETPMFRCSQQKLSDVGRQLSGLPLDAAVLQSKFSSKRAAEQVFLVLSQAQANAKSRGKEPNDYIISEAVTGRGKYMKRLDIKGRGRCGIIRKPHAFIRFVLEIPDKKKEIGKMLQVKKFQREQKPVYIKLDY